MKKKKLSHEDARRMLEAAGIDFRKDVFTIPISSLEMVAETAKLSGYRKSRTAPGATGRMYFEYLSRLKGAR